MEYVELLRARRLLTWYTGIVVVLLGLGLALAFKDGPPHFHTGNGTNEIPLSSILSGCAFAPLLLAAFLAVCFDAEYKTVAITWTRPMSRLAIAARYLAVDFGTLIAAWLITVVLVVATLAALGLAQYLTFTHNPLTGITLTFGCAVMWYGLVVLVTMLLPGRASAIAGGSWAYVLIVPAITQIPFPPLLHSVVYALNYINPLAYFGSVSPDGSHPFLGGTMEVHALVAWLIGLAAIAIGVRIWATREVPT